MGKVIIVISASGSATRRARKAGVAQMKAPMREARSSATFRGGWRRRGEQAGREGIGHVFAPGRLCVGLASKSRTGEGVGRVAGGHFRQEVQGVAVHSPTVVEDGGGHLRVVRAGREDGAAGAALSGSGPSVLALCAGPTAALAEAMQEAATRAGLTAHARELTIVAAGATVVPLSR
jgi:hypothetical protein